MSTSLRSKVIRLASTFPPGSRERRLLINASRWTGSPSPMEDLDAYLKHLVKMLLLPYPAIYSALGVEKDDVAVRIRGNIVSIISPKAKTDIDIKVQSDGDHLVVGEIKGVAVSKTFKYQEEYPGLHRGTQGEIVSFIGDVIARAPGARIIYEVHGISREPQVFHDEAALLRAYQIDGRTQNSGPIRVELRDQPKLKNMAGPVWGGRRGDVAVVRYDTWELHKWLST